MNFVGNDTQDVIECKHIISTFIYTFCFPPQVFFYEKMVIFELILNNTFRYQIMVQAKLIAQVTNTCGNSDRTGQNKRATVTFKPNLIIVVP